MATNPKREFTVPAVKPKYFKIKRGRRCRNAPVIKMTLLREDAVS